ncbi:MAG TPA: VWA domain-containing protein [Terriglobales bacterium]|nr:VWA domain-containing protein [Terriglobales bacterium]
MSRSLLWFTLSLALFFSLPVLAQRGGGGGRGASGASAPQGSHVDPLAVSPGLPTTPNVHHASEEGKLEFHSQTVLVEVPTVVTEKSGAHVHNLTKEKFHVFENGKEQKIASLEEIVTSSAPPTVPAKQPGVFTNVVTSKEARNVTLVALDTVNTPFLDQAYGRQQLVKFLANNVDPKQPIGMVMITSKGLKVVQSLSSDPGALVNILKKLSGEITDMEMIDTDTRATAASLAGTTAPVSDLNGGLFQPLSPSVTSGVLGDFVSNGDVLYAQFRQENAIETTMQAFLGIAWTLSGVEGRKTLLWATGGFPFYMDSPDAIPIPGGRLTILYERAMQALNDAQVVIYPVDVRGLVNNSPIADGKARRGGTNIQFTQRAWLQQETLDTLVQFAEMTGGRAFYNTNDVAGSFKKAMDDASSYYMLTYYMDTKNQKSGWRKLNVKVDDKDVEVRSRTGFLVTNITMNPQITQQADMNYAATAPFDATGIPMEMRWRGQVAEGDKRRVGFGLQIPTDGVTIQGDQNIFDLDFLAVATKDGSTVASVGQPAKGALSPENLAKVKASGVLYSNSFVLPPGSYQVRVLVRDNLSGKMGSVTAPLTVD